jgi:hypothetical protein
MTNYLKRTAAALGIAGLLLSAEVAEAAPSPCNFSFAGYEGMCKTKTLGGSTVLVKEYPPTAKFIYFLDKDNDGCFDETGKGFYSFNGQYFTESHTLPKEDKYCLDNGELVS